MHTVYTLAGVRRMPVGTQFTATFDTQQYTFEKRSVAKFGASWAIIVERGRPIAGMSMGFSNADISSWTHPNFRGSFDLPNTLIKNLDKWRNNAPSVPSTTN
jgi:hypothetical protein